MIVGKHDTYFTLSEFAEMIGRSEKTVQNWVSDGRLQFAYFCNVPLISMAMVESLIAGNPAEPRPGAEAAMRAIGRRDRVGQRTTPERHCRQRRMTGESAPATVLHPSEPSVRSSRP